MAACEPCQSNHISEASEDSRSIIARLQAKLYRPPRYYPPPTNPENKFPRQINDQVIALGVPPLSPLQEERGNYVSSFSQYGPPKPRVRQRVSSCDPSYFENETTHRSRSFSGKFEYCPSSTPMPDQYRPATHFPTPRLSPIRMGRDLFAPDPSVYRTIATPPGSPPRQPPSPPPRSPSPSPRPTRQAPRRQLFGSDRSCSLGDMSELVSCEESRGARSPRPGPSRRSPSPPPARRPPTARPEPECDSSCSIGDLSAMMSFEGSRRTSPPVRKSPPPPAARPEPECDSSCSIGDLSAMMSFEGSRRTSPPVRRSPPSPAARPEPECDSSCSMSDLSDMMSFERGPGGEEMAHTPESISGLSRADLRSPGTRMPAGSSSNAINRSMQELASIEVDEILTIQDRMRSFQDARRELLISIMTLSEPNPGE